MLSLFLLLSATFLFTLLVGQLLEKIRVPWVFAALIFGSILAIYNPFSGVTNSDTFGFLGQMGLFFLLFIVGLEIDLPAMAKAGKFIARSTVIIIFFEAFFGSLLIHFVFHTPWLTAMLVALSFATVGEAILVPILDEFGILNTKLGRAIIGVGTLDDIIEILTLILAVFLVGAHQTINVTAVALSLGGLFALTVFMNRFAKEGKRFGFFDLETLFVFAMFLIFLFVGIGTIADSAPLAALLAGISLRTFLPAKRLKLIEKEIKAVAYGLFAPIFFVWIGASIDFRYLISAPLLVLLVVAVSKVTKIVGSYLTAHKELGMKQSILLGIGLSVRFSTSIIIIKILFDSGVIGSELYSVIVASSIVFKFIVPVLFSNLLVRWKVSRA